MKFSSLLFAMLFARSLTLTAQHDALFTRGQKAPNVHHVGDVWLSHLSAADTTFPYNVAVAEFAANARLDWHLHPAGQQLLITSGKGYYQERNSPVRIVRKGDFIKCTPGVEHWHSSAVDSGVTYLAMSGNLPTQWFDRVTEEEYLAVEQTLSMAAPTVEETLLQLSKDKWIWMANKDVTKLDQLFDEQSMFVHMIGSWGKNQELEVIKSGNIHYKKADIQDSSVKVFDNTAIVLSQLILLAEVGGNEVTNPFMVTEVYVKKDDAWKLGSLSFTKLLSR